MNNRSHFSDSSNGSDSPLLRELPGSNAASLPLSQVASVMFSLTNPAEEQKDNNEQQAARKKRKSSTSQRSAGRTSNTGKSSKKRASVVQRERIMMPKSFQPQEYDVICAKGKVAANHSGNGHLRQLVAKYYLDYGNATTRYEKTKVVTTIIEDIRNKCSDYGGGFVKLENDRWFEIGENAAREKVGQHLRERLHIKYKSSTKAKRRMKKEMNRKIEGHLETAITNNVVISRKIQQLSDTINMRIQSVGRKKIKNLDDDELESMMTEANIEILASLKSDETIQRIWREEQEQQQREMDEDGEEGGDEDELMN